MWTIFVAFSCRNALARDQGYVKAYLQGGEAHFRVGNGPEALSYYTKALSFQPASTKAKVRQQIAQPMIPGVYKWSYRQERRM